MRNQSPTRYELFAAVLSLIGSLLMQEPTKADQERSNNWRVSPRLGHIANPITADASSVAAGKTVFLRECQQCHGASGKGDGPVAQALGGKVANLTSPGVLAQSDGTLYTKIRTGRSPMHSFKNHLAKEDIWHLINFIRYDFGHAKTPSQDTRAGRQNRSP